MRWGSRIVDSTVVLAPEVQQELSAAIGSKPILQFHTTFGFFGGTTTDLTSPAFSVKLTDGAKLVWGGLTGTLTATRNKAHWTARMSAPHLLLQGAQGGFELTAAAWSGAGDKVLDDLNVGGGTFTVERLDGSGPRPGSDFSLQRISLTSTSKADGEFFNYRIDVGIDAAKFARGAVDEHHVLGRPRAHAWPLTHSLRECAAGGAAAGQW